MVGELLELALKLGRRVAEMPPTTTGPMGGRDGEDVASTTGGVEVEGVPGRTIGVRVPGVPRGGMLGICGVPM